MLTVISKAAAIADLTAIKTASLDGGKVHLYTNNVPITQSTVIGDLTEAAWVGYAPETITTWGAPYVDPVGNCKTVAPSQQFQGPAAGGGPVCYGCYLSKPDGTLQGVAVFDAPVPMTDNTMAVIVEMEYVLGAQFNVVATQ